MDIPNTKKRYGWQSELKDILRQHNHLAAHRNKIVGTETKKKREDVLYLGFRELHELGYKIEHPKNFRAEHMEVLAKHWESQGKSTSTIQNRISIFRLLAEWIGKPGMILESHRYVENPRSVKRQQVARQDKSWSANQVEFTEQLTMVDNYDPHIGAQLRIIRAFGLRVKEGVSFRPHLAEREIDGVNCIVVEFGTKGGRPRVIPVELPIQREALDHAKRFVKTVKGHLGREGLTLEQSMRRFSNTMTKFRITKKGMGVTAHGLRHEYANDKYERDTGVKSPVRGGKKGDVDKDIDYKARMATSEALGHSRLSITASYYGSHRQDRTLSNEQQEG